MHYPLHTTTQTRDTENIPHAFLVHNGVKSTLHIPRTRDYPLNVRQPHNTNYKSHTSNPLPFSHPIAFADSIEEEGQMSKITHRLLSIHITHLPNLYAQHPNQLNYTVNHNNIRSYENKNTRKREYYLGSLRVRTSHIK